MKVGMLTSVGDRCGIATYSEDLAVGLRSLVDLDIVPVWDQASPWEVYRTQAADHLNAADVVHVQHEYSFWGSVLPRRNKFFDQISSIRRPIVMTAHTLNPVGQVLGLDLPGSVFRKTAKRILAAYPPYRRTIEIETFKVADRIIIHDSFARERLVSRGIPESSIRIIPMGVPAADPTPGQGEAFRRKFGLEGRTLLTVFGFVRPGRGYEAALDALSMLDRPATLVMAGAPQIPRHEVYLDALMAEVKSRGLSDQALVTGYLTGEGVAGLMQASDIILCPQEFGTGSYSVLVALPYGRPIIASDLPFFAALGEDDCLLTFKTGDAQDLAARINSVLGNQALREELSNGAVAYAREHTWHKIAEKTVKVYQELL